MPWYPVPGMDQPKTTVEKPKPKPSKPEKLTVFIDTGPDGPGNFVEQNSRSLNWVSVRLCEEYCHSRTDLEIMEFVMRAIETKRAVLGDRSLYQAGNRTISFPINRFKKENDEKRWREAAKVAKFMHKEMTEGRCVLDRRLLFAGSPSRVE